MVLSTDMIIWIMNSKLGKERSKDMREVMESEKVVESLN